MSWTLSTSAACIVKAGLNANSTIVASAAVLTKWSDQAEGFIVATTRKDWVADYGSVITNAKPILDDVTSSIVAMDIINYDMAGYTSRLESQTMLDVLSDGITRGLKYLEERKVQEFIS